MSTSPTTCWPWMLPDVDGSPAPAVFWRFSGVPSSRWLSASGCAALERPPPSGRRETSRPSSPELPASAAASLLRTGGGTARRRVARDAIFTAKLLYRREPNVHMLVRAFGDIWCLLVSTSTRATSLLVSRPGPGPRRSDIILPSRFHGGHGGRVYISTVTTAHAQVRYSIF